MIVSQDKSGMRKSPRLAQGNREPRNGLDAAALVPPRTPHHQKSGARLTELTRVLEAKWQLGLRVGDDTRSPAQNQSPADKAQKKMNRLFFKNESSLDEVLDSFNNSAPGFAHEGRLALFDGMLKSRLLPQSPDSRVGTPLSRSLRSVSQTLQPRGLFHNVKRDGPDYYTAIEDLGSPTDVDTDDDFVTTRSPSPPASPTPASRPAQQQEQASSFIFSRFNARKRPSDDPFNTGSSSKLTKTTKGKQAPNASIPTSIPTPPLFKKPSLEMARPSQAAASATSSVNTSFNDTTAPTQEVNVNTANTSFTSYDGMPDSDITYPRLTRTSSTILNSLDSYDFLGITAKEDGLRDNSYSMEGEAVPEFASDSKSGSVLAPPSPSSRVSAATLTPQKLIQRTRGSPVDMSPLKNNLESPRSSTQLNSPSRMAYYIRELPSQNLFVDKRLFVERISDEASSIPYFLLFICCRLSISNGIPLDQLMLSMDTDRARSDPDIFWSTLGSYIRSEPRDSSQVWAAGKKSFDGYTFKGKITFDGMLATSPSVFKLRLMPIEQERSCLFQRMFGSDRFLYLTFPSFSEDKTNRFTGAQMQQIEEKWKVWILQTQLFLGRKWRVFHIETIEKKNKARKFDGSDKRVILFATEGVGIEKPISVGEMINDFIDLVRNRELGFCKAIARLDLGLSRTVPTLVFKPSQIKFIRDTYSNDIPEASEFNDPALYWGEQCKTKKEMNDGCARISVAAALKIWELYQRATGSDEPLPSAFQGRIGGAKGMWMINSEPHTRDQADRNIWIEVTDSQLKFVRTKDDEDENLYNPHRLTFNYVKHSFVNGSTTLHIDFIPILVDRGVQRDVIANFMITRLDEDRKKLLGMISDPIKLHNWVTKQGSVTPASGILTWQAALPLSLPEKAKLLLRTGFVPDQSPYLARTLKCFIKNRHTWMEQKLSAPLGKATVLLGLADPENVLNPGEVHIHFSSPFVDEFSRETLRHLDGLEVLVARSPAYRSSDIQKVRAVSHPKLSHLVDVIVFPIQGQFPLAGKLQGGDYDGDTFWTCWEPDLVRPFRNAPAPLEPPTPAKYGIKKDTRRLDQVMNPYNLSTVDGFLKEALEFRAAQSMLGRVTNFMGKVVYKENRISSPKIDALCDVRDLLVDAPKQAYRFNSNDFDNLVRYQLRCGNPKIPAYKQAMEANVKFRNVSKGENDPVAALQRNPNNILDYLYFDIVRKHNMETRKQLESLLPKEEDKENDAELQLPFLQLRNNVGEALDKELTALLAGIEEIVRMWNRNLGDKSDLVPDKYDRLLEKCHSRFRSLQPSNANATDPEIAPLIYPYLGSKHPTLWETIRASALYTAYPRKHAFVWHMAGRELARLKSSGNVDTYHVVPGIFADLKTKTNKVPKPEEDEDSEDEFEMATEYIVG
ncbi:RNA dependent RNA polymerase-domain-containing protein [Pyrenochaeta sp. MPI-SDFR-AT-0127]|nr:RNA dependent RNA polymerase-domain-containing protein [Pyrenochaeta sp. MPI-SDFR-AT-0127]